MLKELSIFLYYTQKYGYSPSLILKIRIFSSLHIHSHVFLNLIPQNQLISFENMSILSNTV